MAFSKERKEEILAQYEQWLAKSQAVVLVEYQKMGMKEIDALRAKVRDAGGEVHVVKNTLFKRALSSQGLAVNEMTENTTLVGFAFSDAPAMAKVLTDAAKADTFNVKGGYLGPVVLSAADVKALADLPPLPVMRATLLGVLSAPASKLVRTLVEPARGLAAVIKAYSEKDAAPAA